MKKLVSLSLALSLTFTSAPLVLAFPNNPANLLQPVLPAPGDLNFNSITNGIETGDAKLNEHFAKHGAEMTDRFVEMNGGSRVENAQDYLRMARLVYAKSLDPDPQKTFDFSNLTADDADYLFNHLPTTKNPNYILKVYDPSDPSSRFGPSVTIYDIAARVTLVISADGKILTFHAGQLKAFKKAVRVAQGNYANQMKYFEDNPTRHASTSSEDSGRESTSRADSVSSTHNLSRQGSTSSADIGKESTGRADSVSSTDNSRLSNLLNTVENRKIQNNLSSNASIIAGIFLSGAAAIGGAAVLTSFIVEGGGAAAASGAGVVVSPALVPALATALPGITEAEITAALEELDISLESSTSGSSASAAEAGGTAARETIGKRVPEVVLRERVPE